MRKKRIFLVTLLIFALLLTGCKPSKTGIVDRKEWESTYPRQVAMFESNSDMSSTKFGGSEPYSYLEKYPYLKTLYDGYGFAKQYDRARGHVYAVEDVLSTARPKKGASCLACKTSEFTDALLKDKGVSATNFEEFAKDHVKVGFTCYDCHGETPGKLDVKRVHINEAMQIKGMDSKIKDKELACAQCHTEYYMTKDENEVKLPWTKGLGCKEAYEYYEESDFFDWEHPGTGAKLLKAQHPEVETFSGSKHENMGLTCLDCHMQKVEVDGKKVTNHHWTSPLKTDMTNSCLKCHHNETKEQLVKGVESVQASVTKRTEEVGEKLNDYVVKLTAAKESGSIDADKLGKMQNVHREAQFYWDYVFVENGEGFHNTEKQLQYLNHADELVSKALEEL